MLLASRLNSHMADPLGLTDPGEQVSADIVPMELIEEFLSLGIIVTVAVAAVPFSFAVTITVCLLETVGTGPVKLALKEPAGTVTVPEYAAPLVMVDTATILPPDGAAAVSVMTHVILPPDVTVRGEHWMAETPMESLGVTVIELVAEPPFSAAVTVTA